MTEKEGNAGDRRRKGCGRGGTRRPIRVHFARGTLLRYEAGTRKVKGSARADRFDTYCHARKVGEFFDLHPSSPRVARNDLGFDLAKKLCSTPGFVPPD